MKRMNLLAVLGAAVLSGVLLLASLVTEAVPTGSWGLSFPVQGQPPQAPVSPERLRTLDAAYCDPDGGKVLYLTFDAGYENGYTNAILDVLQKHQVPAAFFVTGDYLSRAADLVRRMTREGHIVGNHTLSHPDMTTLGPDEFRAELTGAEERYADVTGQTMPKYYRPPQGTYSADNLKMAKELGYKTVFWSLAYVDWNNDAQPSKELAFSKLLPRTHNGAVVLLHSTSTTNAEILDELLTQWEQQGYTFQSIDKLFT